MQHPSVRSVAVVGLPDARLGEIACACIIPEPDEAFTLPEMRTFLAAQQVTRQFWPDQVQVMDAFPTTPSGKVQKFELRQMLAASEEDRSSLAFGYRGSCKVTGRRLIRSIELHEDLQHRSAQGCQFRVTAVLKFER